MKKQIMNLFLAVIFTIAISSGFSAIAQQGSTDSYFPTPLKSRVLSGKINEGSGYYYYSVKAKSGGVVTVKGRIITENQATGGISLAFRDLPGQTNCCGEDANWSSGLSNQEITHSFKVNTNQRFMMFFNFSTTETLSYYITFDGLDFDDDTDSDDSDTITVPGNSGIRWIDTGISVKKGDVVSLDASGTVDVGADWGIHGPEGTTKFFSANYPVNSKKRYGLAAKITSSNGRTLQSWAYGDVRRMSVTGNGRLWLTVNDDGPDDNIGEFKVKVAISSSGNSTGINITSKPKASYTDAAQQARVQGTVTLRVTFLASGQVGGISVVSGLPNGLNEQAIAAARNIRFEPAKKNGVAYTVTQQIQYTFTLDDRKTEPSNITPISWSYLADDANGSVGQRFTFKCLPNPNGEIGIHVSGTDVYHTYSPICWAAVHAGIITPDLGGVVTFEIRAGQAAYIGSKRNGIQSDDYNTSAPRSFVFIKN